MADDPKEQEDLDKELEVLEKKAGTRMLRAWIFFQEATSRLVRVSDLEYAVPFILTMLACHGFFWGSTELIDGHTLVWWEERHPLGPLTAAACIPELSELMCSRFVDQWTLASSRAEHHFWIMRFYTVRYFGFLATAFLAFTAGAACLFVIAKMGWDQVDPRLKGVFLGLCCAAGFFGGFPSLTLHDKNIQDNSAAYQSYDDVQVEIRTYVATGQALNGNHSDPADFAHYVDGKLMALNAVHITFDEAAITGGKDLFLEAAGEAPPEGTE